MSHIFDIAFRSNFELLDAESTIIVDQNLEETVDSRLKHRY